MPRPFRAVIFDLDGVLADSEPWWNEIDKKLLGEYGVAYRGEYPPERAWRELPDGGGLLQESVWPHRAYLRN